jgi:uncharacterized membrane protein (DUF2068 family)
MDECPNRATPVSFFSGSVPVGWPWPMPGPPSASKPELARPAREPDPPPASAARGDRLLPWIAAERAFRALVLAAVGIVLLTHLHENWASDVTDLARKGGLNPKDNWVQRILHDATKLNASKTFLFGVLALGYAALEGTEAYGLWNRRRWGEWLTVLATSLLLIPEVWELTKSTTVLKVGALIVNVAIVAYLLVRLRATSQRRTVEGS